VNGVVIARNIVILVQSNKGGKQVVKLCDNGTFSLCWASSIILVMFKLFDVSEVGLLPSTGIKEEGILLCWAR
jgi:hypothetical protein